MTRRRRRDALPAARCIAIAKSTGQPCSNAAVRGMFCVPHSMTADEWRELCAKGGKTTSEKRRRDKIRWKVVRCECPACGFTQKHRYAR
jgi:hypothetical protein